MPTMSTIRSTLGTKVDQAAKLLADGYLFQERLRASKGRKAGDGCPIDFTFMGKPATLVRGSKGVDLFYNTKRMMREEAMPLPVRGPLFGAGAVHGTDDDVHLARKANFVKVVYDDAQIERFKPLIEDEMRKMVETWGRREGNVYDDTVVAYGRAVLKWAGVPGSDVDLDPWAKRLGQIVEGFGHMPAGHTLAWVNRARCDKWAAGLIEKQRSGQINAPEGSALCEWARYRGTDGKLLDAKLAGIELQNSTRPAIAVSRFAAFAARFLVLYPQYREDIAREVETSGTLVDNEHAIAFAQEVRRLSPFVPMLPAFAREDFEWEGHQIKEGQRVIIDILGTNTDPNEWEEPLRFKPERFLGVEDAEAIKAFIPQGGGDVATGHRCPGEKVAVTELAATVSALCQPGINIDPGDLDYDPTMMPTRPRSGGRVQKD